MDFFQIYSINLVFFRWRPRKKSRFPGPEIFLRSETDLDFSRPRFSEIKVQIKRPKSLWLLLVSPTVHWGANPFGEA